MIKTDAKYTTQSCINIRQSTFKRGALDRRVRIRGSSILLSTAPNAIQSHAFLQHSLPQTFLKSTCLARLPSAFIYLTFAIRRTSILDVSCKITSYFIVIYTVPPQIAPIKFSNVTMLCEIKVQILYIHIQYMYIQIISRSKVHPVSPWCYLERIIAAYYGNRYVSPLTLDSSLEESLARFARGNPVVKTARDITANKTESSGYHILFFNTILQI